VGRKLETGIAAFSRRAGREPLAYGGVGWEKGKQPGEKDKIHVRSRERQLTRGEKFRKGTSRMYSM